MTAAAAQARDPQRIARLVGELTDPSDVVRHAAAALPYGPFQYDEIECGAHGQVERPGALSIGRSTGIFTLFI